MKKEGKRSKDRSKYRWINIVGSKNEKMHGLMEGWMGMDRWMDGG